MASKMGGFSMAGMKKLQKQLNKLQQSEVEAFVDSCAKELAARLLAKVIKRTVDAAFQFITNDSEESHVVNGGAGFGGAPISTEHLFITNDSTDHPTVDGAAIHGGGLVSSVSVTITNDFNEKFNVNGDALNGAGVVFTEFNEMN